MPYVERQLQMLWHVKMLHILFEQLFAYNDIQAVVELRAKQTATSKSKPLNYDMLEGLV